LLPKVFKQKFAAARVPPPLSCTQAESHQH
jgi:hypothetical protein